MLSVAKRVTTVFVRNPKAELRKRPTVNNGLSVVSEARMVSMKNLAKEGCKFSGLYGSVVDHFQ